MPYRLVCLQIGMFYVNAVELGVTPVKAMRETDTDELIEHSVNTVKEMAILSPEIPLLLQLV